MLVYLIKSAACLAIFLLFYKLVLEKESIHQFKRYYLLGALVGSFIIPKLIFTEYVVVDAPIVDPMAFNQPTFDFEPAAAEVNALNLPLMLWTLYGLGLVLFGFKFLKNLRTIIVRIRKNPKFKINSITNVLLNDVIPPHTFFHYIFLNRKKYEADEIPEAVLLHEETHAKQKHSLDVLFVELLQLLFWFNPLIFVTKKAIKLNHEFLADQAVVNKGVDTSTYQNILLAFSSNVHRPELVNSIHYSSIKKRFTVMKKQTSKKAIGLKSTLLVLLVSLLVLSFSDTKRIEIEKSSSIALESSKNEAIVINISLKGEVTINNKPIIIKSLENELHAIIKRSDLEPKDIPVKINYVLNAPEDLIKEVIRIVDKNIYGKALSNPQMEQERVVENIKILIDKHGQLILQDQQVVELQDLKSHLLKFNTQLSKVERQQTVQAKVFPDPGSSQRLIADVERILEEYGIAMVDIVGSEDLSSPSPVQDGASRKEMAEYNKLAKKYNGMDSNHMKILKKDVDRLKYIFDLMSDQQRSDAEPFPDFPEPPPPPAAPNAKLGEASTIPPPPPPYKVPDHGKNYSDELLKAFDSFDKKGNAYGEAVRAYKNNGKGSIGDLQKMYEEVMVLYNAYVELAVKEKLMTPRPPQPTKVLKGGKSNIPPPPPPVKAPSVPNAAPSDVPPPPPPAEPMAPLDHAIEMAKQGATFYYKKNEISSDQAIDILKKNKDLSMDISKRNNQPPVVKIDTHL